MIILLINDKKTDISFRTLKEGNTWIESNSSIECHPSGFSLTEYFDPATLTYYNLVEEND